MTRSLQEKISDYRNWRESLAAVINDYRDWLDITGMSDALQDLRLYDLAQSVRNDRLVLAFVGEFSRGKTETINALFFSDHGARLLPSEAGRTTMCPTEIFWDAAEQPYIRLLPIESRRLDDSLLALKNKLNAWTTLRLDISSAEGMADAMKALAQCKQVSPEEARALGLWNEKDESQQHALRTTGKVEIPVWRHALINYPHPLLKSGLVVLDTPGLNTLGAEPELTISIIPKAHAIIFLLAADTGVTRSDMEIWNRHIRDRASRKLALLNKIDILWDDLKRQDDIDAIVKSQTEATARQLFLPPADVFAISAQKALLARIKGNTELLRRSGIQAVENVLTQDVVSTKHNILRRTIIGEVASMAKGSRKTMQRRLTAVRDQHKELVQLRGKGTHAVQQLLKQVSSYRNQYEATVSTFVEGNKRIMQAGESMMQQLSLAQLEVLLDSSQQKIGESWTTRGLNLGMKSLMREIREMTEDIVRQSAELVETGRSLYQLFHSRHGFELQQLRPLDFSELHRAMLELQQSTDKFCADPVNIMTEKRFLVRKFFYTIAAQVRSQFEHAHRDADIWLKSLLAPLRQQIAEHKSLLDKRNEVLTKANKNISSLQKNMAELEVQLNKLQGECAALDRILLSLMQSAQTPDTPKPAPAGRQATAGGPRLTLIPAAT